MIKEIIDKHLYELDYDEGFINFVCESKHQFSIFLKICVLEDIKFIYFNTIILEISESDTESFLSEYERCVGNSRSVIRFFYSCDVINQIDFDYYQNSIGESYVLTEIFREDKLNKLLC